MNKSIQKILSTEEIKNYRSAYLQEGRKLESWEINQVAIDGETLTASVRMTSLAISPTDAGGFHLTIFSTLEFLSQLAIIYVHVWAGLSQKTQECWMLESTIKSRAAIRSTDIKVSMRATKVRKLKEKILITMTAVITDGEGSFEASFKGVVS